MVKAACVTGGPNQNIFTISQHLFLLSRTMGFEVKTYMKQSLQNSWIILFGFKEMILSCIQNTNIAIAVVL